MAAPPQRQAVVSCHVERLLDDAVWAALERLVSRRPGGFRVACAVRPPDPAAREPEQPWLARARSLAASTSLGLHTHWTSPTHARPSGGNPAERVRRELEWLRGNGLEPAFFVGGGWYTDEAVRAVLAEFGLLDLTATTFPLPSGASRLVPGPQPGLVPATHTLGMAARAVRLPDYVHVYFHDTDLVRRLRAAALRLALAHVGRRRRPTDVVAVSAASFR